MWETVRLGDVASVTAGQSPKGDTYNRIGDGVPFYQGKKDYGPRFLNPPQVWTTSPKKFAEKDDIIISVRAPVGALNVATQKVCIGRGLAAIRGSGRLLNDYLFYVLLNISVNLEGTSGAIFNSINKKQIEDISLPLPPLAEQKRIVQRLDKAFAEIDKAIATAEAKEGQMKSLSSSLLTSVLNTYLGQSEIIALQDVCNFFGDGDWIETKDQAPEGLRLIQTGNIKVGSFADRKKNARYIDEETFKRLRCTEIFAGDLLVSRLPDPVGRACLIPELGERAITAVDCTIIRPKRDFVDAEYLNCYLQSSQYFENVQKAVTGATRQRISRKNLGQIPIIVPPLETQWEIVRRLNRVSEKIETLNSVNSQSQAAYPKLKAAILKQELTPSEAV